MTDDEMVTPVAPLDALASEYGWKPEGEKTSEEYIKVAMEKFPEQSKKIKQLFQSVEDLKVHVGKAEKVAYERAKSELEQQRKQAIKQGDVELVTQIEQAQAEIKPVSLETHQSSPEVDPAIAAFESKYSSMLTGTSFEDLQVQEWLESHGKTIGQKFKLPVDKHMEMLEEHMKKKFSSYFEENEDDEQVVSPVSGSRGGAIKKGKTPTYNDLSSHQKDTANRFERQGIMTKEEYIADLVKYGDI
jgi:hypothetical protein